MTTNGPASTYFNETSAGRVVASYQDALMRCVQKLRTVMPIIGLRNPKIGRPDGTWEYCGPFDWVNGFQAGQLWLAASLTGDPSFVISAQARRQTFRGLLRHPAETDHDLGFQFLLTCVADWKMTGNEESKELAIKAANMLASRFDQGGGYIKGNP